MFTAKDALYQSMAYTDKKTGGGPTPTPTDNRFIIKIVYDADATSGWKIDTEDPYIYSKIRDAYNEGKQLVLRCKSSYEQSHSIFHDKPNAGSPSEFDIDVPLSYVKYYVDSAVYAYTFVVPFIDDYSDEVFVFIDVRYEYEDVIVSYRSYQTES